jgi:hypothetical protein
MRNAEISYISSDSPMVSAEYDQSANNIRPGKKLSIKVTVIAQFKGTCFLDL